MSEVSDLDMIEARATETYIEDDRFGARKRVGGTGATPDDTLALVREVRRLRAAREDDGSTAEAEMRDGAKRIVRESSARMAACAPGARADSRRHGWSVAAKKGKP